MPDKISHLDPDMLERDDEKHRELSLPSGGKIACYHPFKSMQLIFFDIHTPQIPDMWRLGFRKGDEGRYLRTLLCKSGECEFTVNGKKSKLTAGQGMMDYSVGDDKQFFFTSNEFLGVEISMQVDTLVEENAMMKMLRLVIESMGLPEEEIYDADGYVFTYSKNTEQSLNKLLNVGFNNKAGIVTLAQTVEIGHNLGNDLKAKQQAAPDRQTLIAEDIHHCLTDDFSTKYTAAEFAKKYGVSDTTVKKYFKNVYGYGFKEYQTKVRMEWAAEMLSSTNMKIGEISEKTGFARQTKFTKAFKNYYGVTPMVYRRNCRMQRGL